MAAARMLRCRCYAITYGYEIFIAIRHTANIYAELRYCRQPLSLLRLDFHLRYCRAMLIISLVTILSLMPLPFDTPDGFLSEC